MFILREKPFLHPALTLNRTSQPVLSSPHKGLNQDSCTQGTLRCARSRVHFVSSCFACVSCRCNSFMGNTAVQKKPQSKPKKPHLSGHKGGSSSREPQPKRLEEVYTALKQGLEWEAHTPLNIPLSGGVSFPDIQTLLCFSISLCCSEYLEVHQTELDKLMSLMKDMKRNSRLVKTFTSLAQEITTDSLVLVI